MYTDKEKIELFDALMEKKPMEIMESNGQWSNSDFMERGLFIDVCVKIFINKFKYRPKKEPMRFWLYRDTVFGGWNVAFEKPQVNCNYMIEGQEVIKHDSE